MPRRFPATIEDVANRWRLLVLTDDEWERASLPGFQTGESQAFPVRNKADSISGFAKPGRKDASVPRAAHEKIAADLAHEVLLPVPPAVLWKRENVGVDEEALACVSATPFAPAHKWGEVKQGSAPMVARIAAATVTAASAMVPFDMWVANTDRVNEGNVVAQEDVSEPALPVIRVAYIDYAFSLSQTWLPGQPENGEAWRSFQPATCFPHEVGPPAIAAMAASLDRIESVPQDVIRTIVERIPEEFLAAERKTSIVTGLIHRMTVLRSELRKTYGALP